MKKANLFSLQVAVREDGRLAFDYDYVKPDVFIKTLVYLGKIDLKKAKKVFGYSIIYLFLIFVLFLVDNLI